MALHVYASQEPKPEHAGEVAAALACLPMADTEYLA